MEGVVILIIRNYFFEIEIIHPWRHNKISELLQCCRPPMSRGLMQLKALLFVLERVCMLNVIRDNALLHGSPGW